MGGESGSACYSSTSQLTPQHGLEEDVPFEMPNTGGVKVTVIEANHCELEYPC